MVTFHLVTLFPQSFESYLQTSIIGRAIKNQIIAVRLYNPRDFSQTKSRHRPVDDRPYGGGPGMVMLAQPLLKAVERAKSKIQNPKSKIIFFTPAGKQFTNQIAARWAKQHKHLILICGRYEGVDARVQKILQAEPISIGPYVLTGGELPALVVVETITRQLPGVLGKEASLEERRGLAPSLPREVYTRPAVLVYRGKKYRVPKILLSGNHQKIEAWRRRRVS